MFFRGLLELETLVWVVIAAAVIACAVIFPPKKALQAHFNRRLKSGRLSQEEALGILKSLRPVAGTDSDFDYQTGKLKAKPGSKGAGLVPDPLATAGLMNYD